MITLARIFEAWMNAEQFDFPLDPRSLLWHLFKIPHYGFAILSLWTYSIIAVKIVRVEFREISFLKQRIVVSFSLLAIDVLLAFFAFEFFLNFFRR